MVFLKDMIFAGKSRLDSSQQQPTMTFPSPTQPSPAPQQQQQYMPTSNTPTSNQPQSSMYSFRPPSTSNIPSSMPQGEQHVSFLFLSSPIILSEILLFYLFSRYQQNSDNNCFFVLLFQKKQ